MTNNYRKYQNDAGKKDTASTKKEGSVKGGVGFVMCDGCGAVYFKKHWHENIDALNQAEATSFEKNTAVSFETCPACKLINSHQYEGIIVIKNVPDAHKEELEGLINNFSDRAERRDPMDRLIEIKKNTDDWEVTLTENQLTEKLAKKIGEVFDKAKVKIHFAPKPSGTAEAEVEFPAE